MNLQGIITISAISLQPHQHVSDQQHHGFGSASRLAVTAGFQQMKNNEKLTVLCVSRPECLTNYQWSAGEHIKAFNISVLLYPLSSLVHNIYFENQISFKVTIKSQSPILQYKYINHVCHHYSSEITSEPVLNRNKQCRKFNFDLKQASGKNGPAWKTHIQWLGRDTTLWVVDSWSGSSRWPGVWKRQLLKMTRSPDGQMRTVIWMGVENSYGGLFGVTRGGGRADAEVLADKKQQEERCLTLVESRAG